MLKHKAIRYILFFFALLAAISGNAASYAKTSALNTGKWVKIKVEDTGIYQISAATLSGWGFSDISKVKIFGYGGAMISEIMGNGYIDDLPQVLDALGQQNHVLRSKQRVVDRDIGQNPLSAATEPVCNRRLLFHHRPQRHRCG